jgi:hypothetical protein
MAEGETIITEKLEKVKAKLDIYQKKYPQYFSFFRRGESPTSEDYREIEELREERNALVQELDELRGDRNKDSDQCQPR